MIQTHLGLMKALQVRLHFKNYVKGMMFLNFQKIQSSTGFNISKENTSDEIS